MQKDVVGLLLVLDSSLVNVRDKSCRVPADLVPSNALELQDMLQADKSLS